MVSRLAVASTVLLSFIPAPLAHEAKTGWAYDAICCSDRDCRRISAKQVEATARGWRIKLNGDVVPFSQARRSKDGAFHWCTVGGRDDGDTICLYAPDMLN